MIVYVIANEDIGKKEQITKQLADKIGHVSATGVVNYWFDNYDTFVYSEENMDILFYKSRVHGDWKIDENLNNFRIK